jgi:hypothetical protein
MKRGADWQVQVCQYVSKLNFILPGPKLQLQVSLIFCQGYIHEKRRANRTQNSLLNCVLPGGRGLTSSYIVYDYTTSGYPTL